MTSWWTSTPVAPTWRKLTEFWGEHAYIQRYTWSLCLIMTKCIANVLWNDVCTAGYARGISVSSRKACTVACQHYVPYIYLWHVVCALGPNCACRIWRRAETLTFWPSVHRSIWSHCGSRNTVVSRQRTPVPTSSCWPIVSLTFFFLSVHNIEVWHVSLCAGNGRGIQGRWCGCQCSLA